MSQNCKMVYCSIALYKAILTSMFVNETLVLSKLTRSQSSSYSARHWIGAEGYGKGENKRGLDYLPITLCSRAARYLKASEDHAKQLSVTLMWHVFNVLDKMVLTWMKA